MDDDFLNEFLEFDLTMGSDVVKCPHCGAEVSRSLLIDEEIECPECGKILKRE